SLLRVSVGTRFLVLLTAGLSLAMFLYSGFQREVGSQFVWPHGQSDVIASHYIIVPTLLLLSALFIALDAETDSDSVVVRRSVRVGVVTVVLIGTLVSFKISDAWTRGHPTWTSQVAAGRAQCSTTTLDRTDLVIAPNVAFTPRMTVPCDKLLGRTLSGRHPPLPDLHTVVLRPLDNAILSGSVFVTAGVSDNVPVTSVEIRLSEGSGSERSLGLTRLGPAGWLLTWNTAGVANGTYLLQSVAHDSAGVAAKSAWITVVVRNR
ncbi:MAG: Ig-like domain-containing protein, partial [Acidimicrobiales bacterium]